MSLTLFARPRLIDALTPPPAAPVDRRMFANLDRVESLPTLSDTTLRALSLCNNPDATLADMMAVICRDGVLAAALLKLANGAVYGKGVTDVSHAVVRLGLNGCGKVIAAAGLAQLFAQLPPEVRRPTDGVLRHSLFVGGMATAVARKLRLGLGGEEFTAGLLHDIGRVALCVHAPDLYVPLLDSPADEPDVRPRERHTFGTDHCMVGMLFANRNGLPACIARTIRHHHDPAAETEHRALTAVVAFADGVANHLHTHRTLTTFPLDTNPALSILREFAGGDAADTLRADLSALVKRCVRDTRAVLKNLAG